MHVAWVLNINYVHRHLKASVLAMFRTEALNMAIEILQGMQHNAMANRHECNECVFMKKIPQRLHTTFKGPTPLQYYFAFTKRYISTKDAYYISPRCV